MGGGKRGGGAKAGVRGQGGEKTLIDKKCDGWESRSFLKTEWWQRPEEEGGGGQFAPGEWGKRGARPGHH